MTILMTLLGGVAFVLTLLFTKLNFKKGFGVFFAFLAIGLLIDVFLASYASLLISSLSQ